MADNSGVVVKFDGVMFDAWQSVKLRESVDDLCAQLQMGVALPGTGNGLGLTPNTVMTVWADGELVATVRSDVRSRDVGPTSHAISVAARSLGRELVDCQYSATYSGLKLGEIAKRVCKLFGVPLQVVGDTAVVPQFAMQCELPANALINAARSANKLIYPTPEGGLLLTEPTAAAPVATLTYGVDIKHYRVVDEDRLRFSEYVVKSFNYGSGAALKGAVKDVGIEFFRPMHIVGDRAGNSTGGCDRRAQLEHNRRLARSHRLELELKGWHYLGADGKPRVWRINEQVRVVIPHEGIDQVLLVGDRDLELDDKAGRVTRLTLMERSAFVGEPKKTKKRAAGVGAATGKATGAKR
ncbi:phage tail protein [Rhodoferax sp. BLA1]|uniref:phage baseplate assembly protein n=1 Tax=Rhodoferax sp. BLA1 TaxID=2576062 RepID=UPI0015D0FE35|nr:phage tail protein [Rhodoferax sp. BLA1]